MFECVADDTIAARAPGPARYIPTVVPSSGTSLEALVSRGNVSNKAAASSTNIWDLPFAPPTASDYDDDGSSDKSSTGVSNTNLFHRCSKGSNGGHDALISGTRTRLQL